MSDLPDPPNVYSLEQVRALRAQPDRLIADCKRLAREAEEALAMDPDELERQLREQVATTDGDVEGMERAIAEAHAIEVAGKAVQRAIGTAAARLLERL